MKASRSTRAAVAQLRISTGRAAAALVPVSPLKGTPAEFTHPAAAAFRAAQDACKNAPDDASWLTAAEARAEAWEAMVAAGLVSR